MKIQDLMRKGYDLTTARDHVNNNKPLPKKYDFVTVRYKRNQYKIDRIYEKESE